MDCLIGMQDGSKNMSKIDQNIKTFFELLEYNEKEELVLIMKAFVDALDGVSDWKEIQNQTGLPTDRCIEISKLYNKANDILVENNL